MGEIPEAPGLEDLDELYPGDVDDMRAKRDDEEVVEVTSAMPLPAPLPAPTPEPAPVKKKGRKLKFLFLLIILGAIGGAAYYFLA